MNFLNEYARESSETVTKYNSKNGRTQQMTTMRWKTLSQPTP